MKKNQLAVIIVLALSLLAYLFIPSVQSFINESISAMKSVNLEDTIAYIRSYGNVAAVVSFFLMILQSILSPIPAFLITLSNAAIFGWFWGAVLSWTSSMAGAALCFYIAKILGRDAVAKITSNTALKSLDVFFEKYGKYTIVVCRLLPFVSFDLVSYAAGLTSMKFWPFFLATGIGQLPATIVYSYIGQNFGGGGKQLFIGLMSLFAVTIIIYIVKSIYNERHAKKAAK
ncbi:TVP38/TMEM64 family protein [Facklamia sp. 7083-14-GEN3]|uniref:TVP38/TMEM64 family protein n=1 Tax=Facklamia sp. 7083-14-GEN3 TaxID=2973478 RepID=UPI00215C0919|nr:TVP38/TMEM64 family protein [Facklamia sp. 7083-14-GEN3]MCR8968573.1 TVP38/TMEM64 family protein [Facklamia sp. 7083-14-GEN3]